ncbi:hypothetical protein J2Y55_004567 [Bosea sp. BE125]|uniref:hypothetical protein n=1 Tax=Bosea sp. BE125 TaxID=2817909 RepID=UPI0028632F65|nr:hypothetical protein [Bosea sp. BE125]MDR6873540.1 hypothetical protein [Bosea sp. BE125]
MAQEPTQDEIEAFIRQEAFASLTRQLHEVEEHHGIAGAVAAALGFTAAMTQWSEDATGVTVAEAIARQQSSGRSS